MSVDPLSSSINLLRLPQNEYVVVWMTLKRSCSFLTPSMSATSARLTPTLMNRMVTSRSSLANLSFLMFIKGWIDFGTYDLTPSYTLFNSVSVKADMIIAVSLLALSIFPSELGSTFTHSEWSLTASLLVYFSAVDTSSPANPYSLILCHTSLETTTSPDLECSSAP